MEAIEMPSAARDEKFTALTESKLSNEKSEIAARLPARKSRAAWMGGCWLPSELCLAAPSYGACRAIEKGITAAIER